MRNHHLLGLKELRLKKENLETRWKAQSSNQDKDKEKDSENRKKTRYAQKICQKLYSRVCIQSSDEAPSPGEKLAFNGLRVFVVVHSRRIAVSYFKMLSVLFQRNIGLRNIFGSINI